MAFAKTAAIWSTSQEHRTALCGSSHWAMAAVPRRAASDGASSTPSGLTSFVSLPPRWRLRRRFFETAAFLLSMVMTMCFMRSRTSSPLKALKSTVSRLSRESMSASQKESHWMVALRRTSKKSAASPKYTPSVSLAKTVLPTGESTCTLPFFRKYISRPMSPYSMITSCML